VRFDTFHIRPEAVVATQGEYVVVADLVKLVEQVVVDMYDFPIDP
jgi:hypothetical protein